MLRRVAVFEQTVVDLKDMRMFKHNSMENNSPLILEAIFTDGQYYRYAFEERLSRRKFINALREIATEIEKVETPYLYK